MKKFLFGAAKVTGYVTFFLLALLFFAYLTLPMEQAKAYVVRMASTQLDADLEIAELTTWGLTGIRADGLVITFRPTAEERETIRVARAARRAWEERKRLQAEAEARKKAAEALEEEEGAGAGGANGAEADEQFGIVGKTTMELEEEAKAKAAGKPAPPPDKKEKPAKPEPKKPEEKPPEIPSGPSPLSIKSFKASLDTFALIGDLFDGKLFNKAYAGEVHVEVLGGRAKFEVKNSSTKMIVKGEATDLDLRLLSGLKRFVPLPVAGGLRWSIDLEFPRDQKGKLRLSKTEGAVTLNLDRSSIGPGKFKSDALRTLGGEIDVPKLTLNKFGGGLIFEKRRATFEDFLFDGKDVEGSIAGYIQLADSFSRWGPRAFLRFKFSDRFLEREGAVRTLVKTLPYVKRGTAADGFTGFTVTGRLDKPTWRPRKKNPYETRKARPKPAPKAKKGGKGKTSRKTPRAVKGKVKSKSPSRARGKTAASKKAPKTRTAVPAKKTKNRTGFGKKGDSGLSKTASAFIPPKKKTRLGRPLDADEEDDEDEEEEEEDEAEDDDEDDDEEESPSDEDDESDGDSKEDDERDEADAADKEKVEREEGEAEADGE